MHTTKNDLRILGGFARKGREERGEKVTVEGGGGGGVRGREVVKLFNAKK